MLKGQYKQMMFKYITYSAMVYSLLYILRTVYVSHFWSPAHLSTPTEYSPTDFCALSSYNPLANDISIIGRTAYFLPHLLLPVYMDFWRKIFSAADDYLYVK